MRFLLSDVRFSDLTRAGLKAVAAQDDRAACLCRLLPDGELVWESAGDAGLPEGVSANPGGENRLHSGLQHTGDSGAVQGKSALGLLRPRLWAWPVRRCS